ncbi:hypothetical protein I4U23_014374 [Adineta vaga]|nr:hypothetical protein I4U23_014374 [Adineta vaga]
MLCCSKKSTTVQNPQKIEKQPDSSINENVRRINPVLKPADSKIKYSITVKTGNYRNSGSNGPVYLKIFGRDNQQTDEILLKTSSNEKFFPQDSTRNLEIQAIDVGKPQRIIIRHEDKTNGWYLDYIDISVHDFRIRFYANRWLDETKLDRKLSVELFGSEQLAANYNIEVLTGSEQTATLDSPAFIQIFGTTSTTPKIFLESKNASFTKDSLAKFNLDSNNVGQIEKIIIGHECLGLVNDWYLQSVKIQTDTQQHEFIANRWLSPTKGDKKLSVELNRRVPSPPPSVYMVTVHTGNVRHDETVENIEMSVHGSNGDIEKVLLKDHWKSDEQSTFQKGSVDQFEIKHKDIGNIESITIGFLDSEQKFAWLLDSIDIKYKKTVYHFQGQCWLSSRLGNDFNWITLKPEANKDAEDGDYSCSLLIYFILHNMMKAYSLTDIVYKITIITGDSGIDSNVMLCIYGKDDLTKNFALTKTMDHSQAKFDKNSQLEFELKGINVGKIEKINIGHDGKDADQQWLLKSVKIQKKDEEYIFKADRMLSKNEQNFVDLFPEEALPEQDQVVYKITVVTSSEDDSNTDSGVFMTIYGEKGRTKQFQLIQTNQTSDSLFKQGQTSEFEMTFTDVGTIHKINIGQDGKGLRPMWHLDAVQIQNGSELYKFNADKVLDLSMPYIDLTPVLPDEILSSKTSRSSSSMSDKVNVQETTYKVLIRYGTLQQRSNGDDDDDDDDAQLYMAIFGVNGQTKRMPIPKNTNGEIDLTGTDVGQITKITLEKTNSKHANVCHVDHIVIQHGNDTTTFNIKRTIEDNKEVEFTPSPNDTLCDESASKPTSKSTSTSSTSDDERKNAVYTIKVATGERTFNGTVNIRIRGEHGLLTIPLETTKSGAIPFQSKASDEFKYRTTDVGKIKRITIECTGIDKKNSWHMRRIQIIKGDEVYNFLSNVRFNTKEQKLTLHPLDQQREDHVQSELRRLKEKIRNQSSKLQRPKHRAYEPFVYNDLSPYFDTTGVDKALDGPMEAPSGYYTRVTALRVVEPWEAYGMDYGVSYELLKPRKPRNHSLKRSSTTQNGMMMLPPLSLPYGGQIASVNASGRSHSRASSMSSKRNHLHQDKTIGICKQRPLQLRHQY